MIRRRFLKMLGGGAALGALNSGCKNRAAPVSLLAAGSLAHFAEHRLALALAARGIRLRHEALGSAAAARLVAGGQRQPDLVALADPALFDGPMHPAWHALFATGALVIACAQTPGGRRVEAADTDGWFRPVLAGAARLGRTDPDADPLGYRALFLFDLAARHYERSALGRRLRAASRIYPETALLGQLETGALDAAVAYRNMAVERDYPFVALPPALDLSQPSLAQDGYDSVSYTLPDGKTVTGGPIRYGATVLKDRPDAWQAFHTLTQAGPLRAAGFGVPDGFPRLRGEAPQQASSRP